MFWAQVQVVGPLPEGQVVQAGQLVQEQPEDKTVCHGDRRGWDTCGAIWTGCLTG